jgi:Lrp/AsnC family leucine-responsive transcriptional regulator
MSVKLHGSAHFIASRRVFSGFLASNSALLRYILAINFSKKGDFVRQELDRLDQRILAELQRDGRLPIVELAERVALSPTACQRRVRKLEEAGVIERYAAVLNPAALGQRIQAFVRVSIERQSKDVTEAFEAAVKHLPQVRACYVMTGDLDFLLHVFVPDLQAFAEFSMNVLIGLPGVKDVRSSLVLEAVKKDEGVVV